MGTARLGPFRRIRRREIIDVGRGEGRFEAIGFEAKGDAVLIRGIDVVFGNNDVQRIDINRIVRDGERSPALNLDGRGRAIKQIEVIARALGGPRHRALIDVYGQSSRGGREDWEPLGMAEVRASNHLDTIRVDRRGRFSKIVFSVSRDIEILDFTIYFERGPSQPVHLRDLIRAGRQSRPIDLYGDRAIDRVEFSYKLPPGSPKVKVWLNGIRSVGPPPPPPPPYGDRWEELGCSKAGMLPDRDVIRVGRREGRFSAIQLRVSGNRVHILDLRVVYERGPPDDIPVRSEIRDGGETRPLDLRGERRAIDRVELVYLAQPNFRGSARVCVFGRQ